MNRIAALPAQTLFRRSFPYPSAGASALLDALRGLAAFSVFIYHWRDSYFFAAHDLHTQSLPLMIAYILTSLGPQCVIVFFVMSGYLVGGNVLRTLAEGRWSWRNYLFARLTRLYAVLIPALLFGAAFDWMGMRIAGARLLYSNLAAVNGPVSSYVTLSPRYFLANLFFLQNVHPIGIPAVNDFFNIFGSNSPLWSLSNEFWYYLAFPVLVLALSKQARRATRIVCVLMLAIWFCFVGFQVALLGIPWLLGACLHFVERSAANRQQPRGGDLMLLPACLLLLFGMTYFNGLPQNATYMITATATTILMWAILRSDVRRLPSWFQRFAHRAASRSYTLYLVHLPALLFARAVLQFSQQAPSWHFLGLSLSIFIAVLVYTQVVYSLFEKRTDAIRQWLRPVFASRGESASSWFSGG